MMSECKDGFISYKGIPIMCHASNMGHKGILGAVKPIDVTFAALHFWCCILVTVILSEWFY